jgi:LPS-assembly lipoprotein
MNNYLPRKLSLKILLIALFATLLYGCGFHLRGWSQGMPKFMQKVYIEYSGNDYSFLNTLKAAVTSTGADIMQSPDDANIIIQLNNARSSSRLIGITGGASSNQYILSYVVNYQILTNNYQTIFANQIGTASQNYSTNATQQLSNNAQKQQTFQDLQTQVANNIIMQIQTLSQEQYEALVEKGGIAIRRDTILIQS